MELGFGIWVFRLKVGIIEDGRCEGEWVTWLFVLVTGSTVGWAIMDLVIFGIYEA